MNILGVIGIYPIGTKLRLKDDYSDVVHDVHGYEWFGDTANILFRDGTKLNVNRLELIEEVVSDGDDPGRN